MGYKRERRIYNLVFDADQWDGLEIRAYSIPIGQMFDLMELADRATNREDAEKLLRLFAASLVSWNLEDDDIGPIPPTFESVWGSDFDWILPIIITWIRTVGSVQGPLKDDSTSGLPVEEEHIPMEAL